MKIEYQIAMKFADEKTGAGNEVAEYLFQKVTSQMQHRLLEKKDEAIKLEEKNIR